MRPSPLFAAFAAVMTACTQTEDAMPVPPPATEAIRVTAISGTNPFPAGCAPEPDQRFGERVEDAEMESHLAVNPRQPMNMAVGWMQDLFAGLVTAATRDGGRHWTIVPVPGTSVCSGGDLDIAADPTLSFGPDGTLYLAGFSLDLPAKEMPVPTRTRLFATTSSNGGFDWAPIVEVSGGYGTLHDMPAIAADPERPCVAYLVWTDEFTAFGPASVGLMFARTDDCGQSWSAPITVFAPTLTAAPFSVTMGSKLLPMKDGSLLIVSTAMSSLLAHTYPELPASGPESLVAFRSTDGGATWSAAQYVASFINGPFNDPETNEKVLHSPFILSASIGTDGTAFVTWRQQLDEATADIRLVRSSDHGATWTQPIVVRAAGTQMMTPTVATAADGTVAVTYYDIRNDAVPDQALWADFWVSLSSDGGANWTERHVAGPFDLGQAARMMVPVEGLMVGEYAGLVPAGRGFGATFAMSGAPATAGASDIFFAPIPTNARD
jgi:hypothetical protein